MDKAEFDKFADEYRAMHREGIRMSGEEPEYFAEYKVADIAKEFARLQPGRPSGGLKILDFGAGIGGSVPHVANYFKGSSLTCIDPSERSLAIAKDRFPNDASYQAFDGKAIPFANETFDIAYAMCVFHHIDASEHVGHLRELRRVVKPGGLVFIFEHNPYNPLTVHVVNSCPFDENAVLISGRQLLGRLSQAGFAGSVLRYRIFFPNILRAMRPLEPVLRSLPLGAQYYALSRK
jgi:ubiquinone/menaquinone biosynthesis C-methylase UbiE